MSAIVEVKEVHYSKPSTTLPRWVREAAQERGYGDAAQPLSLFVSEADVKAAFEQVAFGNGASCVMAQAGQRLGARSVYFYRKTAWVDFGTGPLVRFKTSRAIYDNVIDPFDRGVQEEVKPGIYHLTPPPRSDSIDSKKQRNRDARARGYEPPRNKKGEGNRTIKPIARHTERVVMATQV